MHAAIVSSYESWDLCLDEEYDIIVVCRLAGKNFSAVYTFGDPAFNAIHALKFEEARLYPAPACFSFLMNQTQMIKLLKQNIDGIRVLIKRKRKTAPF